MKKRNSKGFTLLELIIAIVILGILAVFVAPRFLNLQDDAREAKIAETLEPLKALLNTHIQNGKSMAAAPQE